jgi:hypothetical protein
VTDELIPPDVREFVLTYIGSIAHLEALLLLARGPDERWGEADVAAHLYIDAEEAKAVLDQLCDAGLLRCGDEGYWFNGEPPGQRDMVQRLAAIYAQHLIPITNLVHSRPVGIRAFAAAFKLRKDR